MKPVTLLILGAGSRGTGYADYALRHPAEATVVGVAEHRPARRAQFHASHPLPADNVADDWRAFAARPRFADAVIIATPDADHVAPAIAFAALGYHILLEKPMAPTAAECRRVVAAVRAAGVMFAVAHVMRYMPITRLIKRLIADGAVGDIVNIQHLEPVGFWHQAHAFVRGNWRREDESSPMLLAKCCHDVDWLRHVIGAPCLAVSSFGTLKHFRREDRPAGAADRCLDCGIERSCPYSAKRVYLESFARGNADWPNNVLATEVTAANLERALREGPYGRCVYACDNDVVDNQVLSLLYDGNRTATLTMTAFSELSSRRTRIFGTRGELSADERGVRVFDFLAQTWRDVQPDAGAPSAKGGHGGGDDGLMSAFLAAIARGDPSLILSGPEETLETHLTVFAAEQARHESRVVSVPAFIQGKA